jgi:putative addiction module component (TIGR02574 family)
MSASVEEIRDAALKLPRTARAYVAEVLIESLDDADDVEVPAEALAEAERRLRDIDAGRSTPLPGEEVLDRLRNWPRT